MFSFSTFVFGQQRIHHSLWNSAQYYSNFSSNNLDCSNDSWKLVFYDEFDGNTINTTKWFTYRPTSNGTDNSAYSRGINNGTFSGLFVDSNVEVNNGTLKLHVKKESNTWYGETFNYSASIINSKFNHRYKYGRFEARIKMHKGGGFFPAFWLFNGHEIDIIEYKGVLTPTEFRGTLHGYWANGGHAEDGYSIKKVNGNNVDFSQNFHVYAVEWSPHKIEWFVDGHLVRTFYRYKRARLSFSYIDGTPYLYSFNEYLDCHNYQGAGDIYDSKVMGDNALNIILNTGINNNSQKFGAIKDSDFPSFMEVDYVRVYQKIPQTGKVDLCSGEISGSDEICFNGQQTYTFNTFDGENSTVTWTTSSNLNIINSSNNVITVNPTSSTFTSGWIEATVNFTHAPCSTKIFKKYLYMGSLIEGTYVSGGYNSNPLNTVNFSNSNSFNITLDNPTNIYTWQLSSGNAYLGGVNWNPQTVQIASGSSSASVNIFTNTNCGLISRTVAFVHTGGWYRISPNPSSNYIYIEAEEDYQVEYSDENGELTTQLIQPSILKTTLYNFNTSEKVLEQATLQPVKNMNLDIGSLPLGQYVLHIKNEYNTTTHQIMIER